VAAARVRVVLDDLRSRDVARHQVGRELDARELEVERLRERVDQECLREAGHADHETVAAREQREKHQLDHAVLADDQLAQFGANLVATGLEPVCVRNVVGGFECRAGNGRGHVDYRLKCVLRGT
jgi:hypothetical protein